MEKELCPTCGKRYDSLVKYCTRCGISLEKFINRCSENKTELCRHKVFADDDVYCCYCGSLTTFALEKQKGGV